MEPGREEAVVQHTDDQKGRDHLPYVEALASTPGLEQASWL